MIFCIHDNCFSSISFISLSIGNVRPWLPAEMFLLQRCLWSRERKMPLSSGIPRSELWERYKKLFICRISSIRLLDFTLENGSLLKNAFYLIGSWKQSGIVSLLLSFALWLVEKAGTALNQSNAKPKLVVTWSLAFSRPSHWSLISIIIGYIGNLSSFWLADVTWCVTTSDWKAQTYQVCIFFLQCAAVVSLDKIVSLSVRARMMPSVTM